MIEYSEALRRNKMRFFIFNHTCSINAHGKNFNLPFFVQEERQQRWA